jgi:hypothetical protein
MEIGRIFRQTRAGGAKHCFAPPAQFKYAML